MQSCSSKLMEHCFGAKFHHPLPPPTMLTSGLKRTHQNVLMLQILEYGTLTSRKIIVYGDFFTELSTSTLASKKTCKTEDKQDENKQ